MIDRPRAWNLGISAACFAFFAVVAALVTQKWRAPGPVRRRGQARAQLGRRTRRLVQALRVVEHGFGTIGITILTVLVSVLLLVRGQRRAAFFTAGVMIVNGLATTFFKQTLGRDRPLWQDPTGIVENHSFPSGHTTTVTAFTGVMIVLAVLFVRRRNLRIACVVAMVAVAVIVGSTGSCWAGTSPATCSAVPRWRPASCSSGWRSIRPHRAATRSRPNPW